AVPLRQLFAVGPEDHGQVAVFGQGGAQGAQNVDLPGRVVDVVVAAQHVGDVHVPVVDHHTEVIGGGAIRTGDDEIVQFCVVEADGALDQIVPCRDAVQRIAKAHHRLAVRGRGG